MFLCPRDTTPLRPTRNDRGVYYRCGVCDGWLVAAPMVRNALGRDQFRQVWNDARGQDNAPPSRLGLRCASCGREMREVIIPADDAARERIPVEEHTPEIRELA